MKSILLLSFSVFITSVKADAGFILMTTTSDDTSVEVCSDFNPLFKAYPEDYDDSTGGMPVLDLYPNNGCDPPQDPALYRGKAVIMKRHKNCSFAQRGKYVQNAMEYQASINFLGGKFKGLKKALGGQGA